MSQTKLIIYQLKQYTNDLEDNVNRKNINICCNLSISFDFRWLFDWPVNPPGWLIDWKMSWFVTRTFCLVAFSLPGNYLFGWLAGELAGWLVGWLSGWLSCWLAGCLSG
jgi:hypothetical protein